MSLRDQIQAIGSKFTVKKVPFDGMKELYVREISAGDREAIEDGIENKTIGSKLRATIFIKSVCDKDGNLVFTDEDLDEVNGYRLPLLQKVFEESNKINGLVGVDAVNEAEKNS